MSYDGTLGEVAFGLTEREREREKRWKGERGRLTDNIAMLGLLHNTKI